ncbi:AbiEi antitoxin N-terminal domain-containing protein [Pedobacter aquatilis]|uniref:AbiEi antitoxin N-terminal domain-containing protein n=1 Tax=Pedobacter aquatilis TaxID=351343 RepID=UPI00292D7367|nr:AbiEi antitoxin N-terminal domain-containing protein [Pedobacter aquatilis]
MSSIHSNIENAIKRYKRGDLIFPVDFRSKGNSDTIKKALSRLAKEGTLKRLGHGIYVLPKKDPLFGDILPSAEEVAIALAKKDQVRIKPAGAHALHKLGLSTQVPMKLVYLTDGSSREIKIGKNVIKFKASTPKKLSLKGTYSSLIILALEELDLKNIDEGMESRLRELLKLENQQTLNQDLKKATIQVAQYLTKLISTNDPVA